LHYTDEDGVGGGRDRTDTKKKLICEMKITPEIGTGAAGRSIEIGGSRTELTPDDHFSYSSPTKKWESAVVTDKIVKREATLPR
jgi:hypothetical protein